MKKFLFVSFLMFTGSILAQNFNDFFNGDLRNFFPKEKTVIDPEIFFSTYGKLIGLRPEDEFKLLKYSKDKFGYVHYKYQQYYNGVELIGGEMYLHAKDNKLIRGNGNVIFNVNNDLKDNYGISNAIKKIIDSIPVQLPNYDFIIQQIEKENNEVKPELRVLPFDSLNEIVDFVYKLHVGWPLHKYFYISAKNGEIITTESSILSCGPGIFVENCFDNSLCNTMRYGSQRLVTCFDENDNLYHLHDCTRDLTTLNFNYSINSADFEDFTDLDNHWNNMGEMENEFMDAFALDAHFCISSAYDMYLDNFGINGYDGLNTNLEIGLHYPQFGDPGVLNAFWDNSSKKIYIGDGDGIISENLSSLDILGHEYSHGVMFNNPNINIGYGGEMGALQEGLADIFGILTSFSTSFDNNWIMGEEIFIDGGIFQNVRNLENPNDPTSLNFGPDTYLGDLWATSGAHQKSLVVSHWFYLFVNGGEGTNDFGNYYSVNGTMDKYVAGQFLLNALYSQAIPNGSSLVDFANSLVAEAILEWGYCSLEYNRLLESLYAVGLTNSVGSFSISLSNLVVPNDACTFGINNILPFELTNNSCTTILPGTNITFNISINGNNQPFNYIVANDITTGNSIIVNTPPIDLSINGKYFIEISLVNPLEFSISDNSVSGMVKNVKEIIEPTIIDFEDADLSSFLPNQSDYFYLDSNVNSHIGLINFGFNSEWELEMKSKVNSLLGEYSSNWNNFNNITFNKNYVSSINFCLNPSIPNLNLKSKIRQTYTNSFVSMAVFKDNTVITPFWNASSAEVDIFRDEIANLQSTQGSSFEVSLKNNSKYINIFTFLDNIEFFEQFSKDLELNVNNIPTSSILPGNYPISLGILNMGTLPSSSYSIQIDINGTTFILPMNNLNIGQSINIENIFALLGITYEFGPNQTYNITVSLICEGDLNPDNNTISFSIQTNPCIPLSGEYYIGGSSGNFSTINEAIEAVINCGIMNHVELIVDGSNGEFDEQIVIPHINRYNGDNWVLTLRGINNAKIKSASNGNGSFSVVKIIKTKNIRLVNLKIERLGEDVKGACVFVTDTCSEVHIDSCLLKNNINQDQQYGALFGFYDVSEMGYKNLFNNCNVRRSVISCKNIGVFFNSSSNYSFLNPPKLNGVFYSNINSAKKGIYGYNNILLRIENNVILSDTNSIHLDSCFGSFINRNTLFIQSNGAALKLVNTKGLFQIIGFFPISILNEIYNNFLSARASYSGIGIDLVNSDNLFIYNNSVSTFGGENSRAFRAFGNGARILIKNNSFSCFGNSGALAFESDYIYPSTVYKIDYNNLYVQNGSNLVNLDGILFNSNNYKDNTQGYFQNSISVDPEYKNIFNDLHINCSSPLIDRGEVPELSQLQIIPGKDIDNEIRNVIRPDIGADEYRHKGLKTYLEGSYTFFDMATNLDDANLIPINHPYGESPYFVGEIASVGNNYDSIVDWVMVEARNTENICGVEAKTTALLLNNGYIVSPNNLCELVFPDLEFGDYFFVVRQRNHMDIMTREPVHYPFYSEYDFTLAADTACNSNLKNVGDRTFAMFSGDLIKGGEINNIDQDVATSNIGILNSYSNSDLNLNGEVTNEDLVLVQQNVDLNPITCQFTKLDHNGSLCNPCTPDNFDPNDIPFEVFSTHNLNSGFALENEFILCGEDEIYFSVFPNNGDYLLSSVDFINVNGTGTISELPILNDLVYFGIHNPGKYTFHILNRFGCEYLVEYNVANCNEICNNGFDDDFDGFADCNDSECSSMMVCCLLEPNIFVNCSSVYEPVCGCNGITYQNSCIADAFVLNFSPGICIDGGTPGWFDTKGVFCYKKSKIEKGIENYSYNVFWDKKYAPFDAQASAKLADSYCVKSNIIGNNTFNNQSSTSFFNSKNVSNIAFSLKLSPIGKNTYKGIYSDLCIPCIDLGKMDIFPKIGYSDKTLPLKLYPNPISTNHELFIELPTLNLDQEFEIRIDNLLGQNVFSQRYLYNGKNILIINGLNLAGMYVVTLNDTKIVHQSNLVVIE